jgi:hypothetical protein
MAAPTRLKTPRALKATDFAAYAASLVTVSAASTLELDVVGL